jgi:hypothetical protein
MGARLGIELDADVSSVEKRIQYEGVNIEKIRKRKAPLLTSGAGPLYV